MKVGSGYQLSLYVIELAIPLTVVYTLLETLNQMWTKICD
jgi:hypothetical protein